MNADPYPAAGLLRRLAAGVYDLLLLGGLLMALSFVIVAVRGGEPVPPGNPWYQAFIVLVTVGFFVGFWTRGGQTLGMRAWRLRLETADGGAVIWPTGLLRLAAAALSTLGLGLGFAWILVDPQRLAWHDRLTGTRVAVIPKTGARPLSASARPSRQ